MIIAGEGILTVRQNDKEIYRITILAGQIFTAGDSKALTDEQIKAISMWFEERLGNDSEN